MFKANYCECGSPLLPIIWPIIIFNIILTANYLSIVASYSTRVYSISVQT